MVNFSIPELVGLDPSAAAGILARAALALESADTNPDSRPIQPDEISIREKIIHRVSQILVHDGPIPPDTLQSKIVDWLDNAAISISEPEDDQAALKRLSLDAALASDIYDITFDENVVRIEALLGVNERDAVRTCIKRAQFSEEFNPASAPDAPKFVSIFGQMIGEFNDRSRYMLIAVAERRGLNLDVKHYWRIYNTDVPLYPLDSLTSLLRKFADVFGYDFTMNGWRGRFLLFETFPERTSTLRVQALTDGQSGDFYAGCVVTRFKNGFLEAAIGININITKYKRRLRQRYHR